MLPNGPSGNDWFFNLRAGYSYIQFVKTHHAITFLQTHHTSWSVRISTSSFLPPLQLHFSLFTPVRQVCFQLLDHTTEFPISTLVLIKSLPFPLQRCVISWPRGSFQMTSQRTLFWHTLASLDSISCLLPPSPHHILKLSLLIVFVVVFSAVSPTRMYALQEWRPYMSFPLLFPPQSTLHIGVQKQVGWMNKCDRTSKIFQVLC